MHRTSPRIAMSRSELLVAALIGIVCLLMAVAVVAFLLQARSRVIDRTRSEASALAETVEQHAERSMQEVDLAIRAVRDAVEASGFTDRIDQMAADYSRWLPQVERMVVLDRSGLIAADSRPIGPRRTIPEVSDQIRRLADDPPVGLTFGVPMHDPATGGWRISMSRPLRDADGRAGGVVIALVRLEHFASFYRSLGFQGPTTVLSLLDGQTRLLVRHPDRPELIGKPLPDDTVLDAAIEPGRAFEIGGLSMLDGGTRHAYVHQVGRFPIFALVGADENVLLGTWRFEALTFTGLLLVLVVTIACLGWTGVRQMARTRESQREVALHAEWLDATIEAIDQGITVYDGEARLVTWNQNAERLLGTPPGELQVGIHFSDAMRAAARRGEFAGQDVEAMVRERLANALSDEGEVRDLVRPNGLVIEVRRTPMATGGFVSTYRDITAERQAARDLEQRAEILRILHSIAQAANEAPDLSTAMRQVLHLIAEGAGWPVAVAHRLQSATRPTQSPAHWYMADPERFEPFRAACAEIRFRPGEGLAGEVLASAKPLFVRDLGSDPRFQARAEAAAVGLRSAFAVPVLERRQVAGVLVFFSDQLFEEDYFLFAVLDSISAQISRVAERERSEAGLKARELRLRSIFDSVDDGLFTINESGSVETMNPAAERIFAVSAADAMRRDIRRFIDGGDVRFPGPNVIDRLVRATAGGPLADLEGRRADGTLFPLELVVRDMLLEDRRGAVVVMRDISERRRVDRMKNEFVSTVSHELRTPLTSIAGSLGLLAGGVAGDLSARAKQLVEIARNNSNRLVLLINDILDLEKIEAGRMEFRPREVDMVELARQAIDANRAYAFKYAVEYRMLEPSQPCPVTVDPDRIIQVFNNLLSNAAKFSPAGGAVDVVVTPSPQRVRVEVIDRGQGIPQAFQGRIFEKFSQADSTDTRAKGGTGLGLSIVRTIVERSGGAVGFVSVEGEGTTFWLELPALAPATPTVAGDPAAGPDQATGGRALCLLREGDVAEAVVRILVAEGFEAEHHASLDTLRATLASGRGDILIIDLDAAGREGVTFIQELRSEEATRDIPVFPVSTSGGQPPPRGGGAALALGDWLALPIDEQRLAEAIHTLFDGDLGKARVLHVEDDPDIVEIVRVTLRGAASVHAVPSIARARALLAREAFDVVLLDLELEDGNGAELIPALTSASGGTVPVILFSASEPPPDLLDQVAASLLKSKTSLDALRMSIGSVARRRRRTRHFNQHSDRLEP